MDDNDLVDETSQELVVVARNPAEMQVAQTKLIGWARSKMQESFADLQQAEANLAQAKKSKWRQTGFQTHVRRAKRQYEFYEKMAEALEAGYVIVPNFDLDIFAIRSSKAKPKHELRHSSWRSPTSDEFEQQSDRSQAGQGEYRDPWPKLERYQEKVENTDGKLVNTKFAYPIEWNEPDFPFKLAKPSILDDTAKAMALKIFDQLGVTPHRRVRNQDPMVIGQIVYKHGTQEKCVSFLVTWWLEQSDLEI